MEQQSQARTASRLRLPVSREDDGRILKCEARHEALTDQLRAEAALSVQCKSHCRLCFLANFEAVCLDEREGIGHHNLEKEKKTKGKI